MADVKISELTALTSPDGAEELVVNDSGTTKKITITNATSASLPKAGGTMTGALFIASPNQATGGNALQIRQGNATTFGIDMGLSQTDGHLNISRVNSGTSTHMMTLARDTGNVGIGTASPSARFEVEDNGSATGGVIMKVTQDDQGSHYGMSVGNDSYSTVDTDGFVVYQMNNGHTYLYNGGVDEGPNIGMPVAGGITFGTDTAAANTLDDYEEGTWTPTDSSGAGLTLSVSGANYVKVGTLIHVNAYLNFPSNSNGAGVRLGGLPFTAKNNQNYSYLMGRSTIGGIMLQVDNNSTTFDMRPADSDNGVSNAQISNSHILFSGTYITA